MGNETTGDYQPSDAERMAGGKFFIALGLALTSDTLTEGSLPAVLDEALEAMPMAGLDLLTDTLDTLGGLVNAERTLRNSKEES